MRDLIEEFNADKTARPDFALETAGELRISHNGRGHNLCNETTLLGGRIVTTRDTEEYPNGFQTKTLFGIPICYGIGAKAIIQVCNMYEVVFENLRFCASQVCIRGSAGQSKDHAHRLS